MTSAATEPLSVPTLASLTTLRVGGVPDAYVAARSEQELVDAVRAADEAEVPLLVLGGGSNVVVADEGFDGVVVRDLREGITPLSEDTCGGAAMSVVGGHPWDDVVRTAVENEWVGVEALSGIPGTTGAAPVQNIGAYGQEVAGAVANVRTWDRGRGRVRTFAAGELRFGYRTSLLKQSTEAGSGITGAPWYPTPRYVVLAVELQLRLGSLSAPIAYPELARRLGVGVGERAPMAEVREAVLALRAGKGMLAADPSADEDDHDRWSVGSFFTNPVVPASEADALPDGAPRFEVRSPLPAVSTGPSLGAVDPTRVKTSAAWLIEHAGFSRGFGVHGEASAARLSTKHTLAITNRGGASAADVVELARTVRDGVRATFGIELVPEPNLVGLAL